MRWPWTKKPKAPEIPIYKAPIIDFKPLEPKDPDIIVEESELTQTGMWRIFPWTKKEPKD
jgi:hypothetical protein